MISFGQCARSSLMRMAVAGTKAPDRRNNNTRGYLYRPGGYLYRPEGRRSPQRRRRCRTRGRACGSGGAPSWRTPLPPRTYACAPRARSAPRCRGTRPLGTPSRWPPRPGQWGGRSPPAPGGH
eukprot:1195865-Prorocentrum_minimum.AAC.9